MNIAFYPSGVYVKLFYDKDIYVKCVFVQVSEYREGKHPVNFYTSRNRASLQMLTADEIKAIPGYETGTDNPSEALEMEKAIFGY